MSTIRPGLPATTLPVPGEGGRARQAQSAFFRAAMEAASPTAQAQTTPRTTTATPAVRPVQASTQDGAEPTRPLRPGSLLDIRI